MRKREKIGLRARKHFRAKNFGKSKNRCGACATVSVFTYCGRNGGIELNNCYFINNRILKSGQVRVIRDALRCLARSKDEQATEARSVLFNVFHE